MEDPEAVAWLHKQIEDVKPTTIVHLGDLLEADSASKFPSETDWDLRDEFDSAGNLLQGIREVGGEDTTYVMLEGNHDLAVRDQNRIDPKLRSLCDWRNIPEMDNWLIGAEYKYCRKRGAFRIGQVTFSHGFECGSNAGAQQSVYMGNEFGLFVWGHSHRAEQVQQTMWTKTRPLRYWHANAGTLGKMDREYMRRKRKQMWSQACVVGEAKNLNSPRVGRHWTAETRVFRTYGDAYEG
jgi:predicted phosphodiesterase